MEKPYVLADHEIEAGVLAYAIGAAVSLQACTPNLSLVESLRETIGAVKRAGFDTVGINLLEIGLDHGSNVPGPEGGHKIVDIFRKVRAA